MAVLHVKAVKLLSVTCEIQFLGGMGHGLPGAREARDGAELRTSGRPQPACGRVRRGREQEAHEDGHKGARAVAQSVRKTPRER